MTWNECLGVFVLGLTGTGHCLGMCGGFAVAVSRGAGPVSESVVRHTAYQIGKATSYVFIGLLLLLAAQWVQGVLPVLQNCLGVALGVAMVLWGVAYTFEIRFSGKGFLAGKGGAACGILGGLAAQPSLGKSLLAGWLNGLLPCGLSMMALLVLVNGGSVAGVVVGGYVFGLATLPGLLTLVLVGRQLGVGTRRWMVRLAGVFLIAFGLLTALRGVPAVHGWMHEHMMPSALHRGDSCCSP